MGGLRLCQAALNAAMKKLVSEREATKPEEVKDVKERIETLSEKMKLVSYWVVEVYDIGM